MIPTNFNRSQSLILRTYRALQYSIVIVGLFAFTIGCLSAQISPPADSLLQELQETLESPERVDLLNQAAKDRIRSHPDMARTYAHEALKLAKKLNYTAGQAESSRCLGQLMLQVGQMDSATAFFENSLETYQAIEELKGVAQLKSDLANIQIRMGVYDKALDNCHASLDLYTQLNDSSGMANVYNQIGIIFDYQGNYLPALDWYRKSLVIQEATGNRRGTAVCYSNLGIIYQFQEDYEQSLKYATMSMEIMLELGDSVALASIYNNVGILQSKLGHKSEAMDYYSRSLGLSQRINKKRTWAIALSNLAQLYSDKGDFETGIDHYLQAIDIYVEMGYTSGIADCKTGLAECYLSLGQPQKALPYARASYQWSVEKDAKTSLKTASLILSKVHAELGNFEEAYQLSVEHKSISDSLLNKETVRKSAEQALEYQYDKEVALQEMEQAKQDTLREAALSSERIWKWVFVIGFLVLAAFIILGVVSYRKLKRSNATISAQRDEILFLNQNLESLVEKRTQELERRNQKLAEYVFTNSHRVRGPIARILGLLEVHRNNGFSSPEEQQAMIDYVSKAAQEADGVIHEIGLTLEDNSKNS